MKNVIKFLIASQWLVSASSFSIFPFFSAYFRLNTMCTMLISICARVEWMNMFSCTILTILHRNRCIWRFYCLNGILCESCCCRRWRWRWWWKHLLFWLFLSTSSHFPLRFIVENNRMNAEFQHLHINFVFSFCSCVFHFFTFWLFIINGLSFTAVV